MNAPEASDPSEREIVITRVFDAPRNLVWQAWTEPEHVAAWWGPRGFTTTVLELDLRPGGLSRYVMHGPDGSDYPVKGVFREIVPGERFVSTDEFDEGYQSEEADDLPSGMVITCQFDEVGEQTRLTLTISHPTVEVRRQHEEMGVVAGWNSSLDCLDDLLASWTQSTG